MNWMLINLEIGQHCLIYAGPSYLIEKFSWDTFYLKFRVTRQQFNINMPAYFLSFKNGKLTPVLISNI